MAKHAIYTMSIYESYDSSFFFVGLDVQLQAWDLETSWIKDSWGLPLEALLDQSACFVQSSLNGTSIIVGDRNRERTCLRAQTSPQEIPHKQGT